MTDRLDIPTVERIAELDRSVTTPAAPSQREAGDSDFEIIASTTAKILYWLYHADVRLDSDAAQIGVGLHVKRAIERAAAKEPR